MSSNIPVLSGENGFSVLRRMIREQSILAGLVAMHKYLGNIFQITLPNFNPVVLIGPKANRHILVTHRQDFLWRTENDPVTRLLRHGVLVEDNEDHDCLRHKMDPALQRGHATRQINAMIRGTETILQGWQEGETRDMLVEMRKIALIILMDALFAVNITPDLERMWIPILRAIAYISPGSWIVFPNLPRPGYAKPLRELDEYLFGLIHARRKQIENQLTGGTDPDPDLLTQLVSDPAFSDDLIRDQLLTLLIAGHDTSTALLAWALYLLGKHPEALARATSEARTLALELSTSKDIRQLEYLDLVIKETLRLYPPIHIGNRKTAKNLEIDNCPIPKGARVMVSIYLSHRDPTHWDNPNAFIPERFVRKNGDPAVPPPFTYIPFGGGPRNCIGAAFSQIEAKVVLARILQSFDVELLSHKVSPHMGATLEPRPGVFMRVHRKGG